VWDDSGKLILELRIRERNWLLAHIRGRFIVWFFGH
jgi:hypothetical protein